MLNGLLGITRKKTPLRILVFEDSAASEFFKKRIAGVEWQLNADHENTGR